MCTPQSRSMMPWAQLILLHRTVLLTCLLDVGFCGAGCGYRWCGSDLCFYVRDLIGAAAGCANAWTRGNTKWTSISEPPVGLEVGAVGIPLELCASIWADNQIRTGYQ